MIRPLHDRVLIKKDKEEQTTSFGFVVKKGDNEQLAFGEITAVGKGRLIQDGILPMTVNVGDRVLFNKHAGQMVKINGEELLAIKEDDIVGIVSEE